MEIAKGIEAEEYLKLDLSDYLKPDWQRAFEILEKRLNERFIEPADELVRLEEEKQPIDKKYGFAVLALDFLLTETIQSFYDGVLDSKGQSKTLFKRFLTQRDSFKSFFPNEDCAGKFYENFRCAILHQAQTDSKTKVWATATDQLIYISGDFTILNRLVYHKKIKEEFEIYLKELRNRTNKDLVEKFKRKMDFVAGKSLTPPSS